jgi:hypothetical protein
MPFDMTSVLLLFFCWLAALAILLVFLESWFGAGGENRFVARRASGAYGICSVFLPMSGSVEKVEQTIRSVLAQSYPFVELFLIYAEDDSLNERLAQEFQSKGSHIPVRLVAIPHTVEGAHDRIRALGQAQRSAKGRWYAALDPGMVLDRFAIEASMEFAGTGEFSALALHPGTQRTSVLQRLLSPSMEYLLQMVRLVERRRERSKKLSNGTSYLLMNRESFEVVHHRNRMPGILNEAGWSIWSYQVEGFRTFEGDGSRWIWREIGLGLWPDHGPQGEKRYTPRIATFIATATVASLIPVAGLVYGFSVPMSTFFEKSILVLSAISYSLMAISYYLFARKLHATPWFAPFWFVAQPVASLLALFRILKVRSTNSLSPGVSPESGFRYPSEGGATERRRPRAREASRYD